MSTMRPPTFTNQMIADHLKASKKVGKEVRKSKAAARAFLMKAGILDKSGKLAAPYRSK